MPKPPNIYEFGPYQLDTGAHILLKEKTPVSLQPKSFDLLRILIENNGRAMSKSELLEALWPDTHVEEGNLTFQVSVLRKTLGPEANSYIETVPRHGYRFSAPVAVHSAADESAPATAAGSTMPANGRSVRAPGFLTKAVLGTALAAAGGVAFLLPRNPATSTLPRPVPLTSFPGDEANPALSPDGNHVAFTWNGDKKDNFDIYVVPVPSGAPRRLTTDASDDVSPAWSPDGQTIAFLRRVLSDYGELRLIPASGGPEHRVGEIRNKELLSRPGRALSISWSPDGRWLAASHRESGDVAESIYLFSRTGDRRKLTAPPPEQYGDQAPAFSPDGRTLAFCRLSGWSTSEIYSIPLRASMEPDGEARRLTADNRWSAHPVWGRDGRSILYIFGEDVDDTPGEIRIIGGFRVPKSGLVAAVKNDSFWELSVGRHLVYSRQTHDRNIWRATIPGPSDPPAVPELFMASTRFDAKPKYSPDGKKIAFCSSRSGSQEIWVANGDGSNAVQMTFFGGPLVGFMNWSPDGQWIVFHARPEGQADLFVIPAAGGQPRRLTRHPADDCLPSYSHDGRWIYFQSMRSGQSQVWRMPAEGGEATQITISGGDMPIESLDGTGLYYLRWRGVTECAIWKVPIEGGHPVRIAGPLHPPWPSAYAVTRDGIYYTAPPHSGDQRFIRFYSFASRQTRPIAVTNRPLGLGITISPDGRQLVFDQTDHVDSDLVLIENFRLP